MSETQWVTRALSDNSTPVEITEELLKEKVVILLQGRNVFGDKIFSYLQLSLNSLQELKKRMTSGEHFMPADFGDVLAAGKGEPSQELISEMAVTYNMVDVPKMNTPTQQAAPKVAAGAPYPMAPPPPMPPTPAQSAARTQQTGLPQPTAALPLTQSAPATHVAHAAAPQSQATQTTQSAAQTAAPAPAAASGGWPALGNFNLPKFLQKKDV